MRLKLDRDGATGNLNSEKATGGLCGEAVESRLGVLVVVYMPALRWKGAPRSDG